MITGKNYQNQRYLFFRCIFIKNNLDNPYKEFLH